MTASQLTYDDHQPVGICSAPVGYRVAYVHDAGEAETGWSAQDVVALVICDITRRPCAGSSAPTTNEGREVHALVDHGGWLDCAEQTGNFWRHLPPGAPDPSPGEVADEQSRQRRRS